MLKEKDLKQMSYAKEYVTENNNSIMRINRDITLWEIVRFIGDMYVHPENKYKIINTLSLSDIDLYLVISRYNEDTAPLEGLSFRPDVDVYTLSEIVKVQSI